MRVIAGEARGRTLRAPKESATRPTADKIKGVIFSMLDAAAYKRGFEPDEDGRFPAAQAWPRVLDLFAGSGALGIEALSRGAVHADFVERDPAATRVIEANLLTTGLTDRASVHRAEVPFGLARLRTPVDLVLVDAPYAAEADLAAALSALEKSRLLQPSGAVVLEQRADAQPPDQIALLPLHRSRTHGGTRITLYLSAEAEQ